MIENIGDKVYFTIHFSLVFRQLRVLANKYFAIEFDPLIPVEEKIPHLLTWGSLTQKIMIQCQLHRSALAKTVRECSLVLR